MSRIDPINQKARRMSARRRDEVRGYAVEGCCPGYAPGWEVGANNNLDPCPWQNDLAACHAFIICWWGGQVPDYMDNPHWLDSCSNIQNDWTNLCVVPD